MDSEHLTSASSWLICFLPAPWTTYPAGAPAVFTAHPEDHLQVTVACRLTAHTACKHSPTCSWRMPKLRHPSYHTVQQGGLIGIHTKMLAACLEEHVMWLGVLGTRASQQSSAAPRPCMGKAEHRSSLLGWMTMRTDLPWSGLSRQPSRVSSGSAMGPGVLSSALSGSQLGPSWTV